MDIPSLILLAVAGLVAFLTHKYMKNPPVQEEEVSLSPPKEIQIPLPVKQETMQEKLYNVAKSLLGTHQTLNEAVPWMVGCAEGVSSVLEKAGYTVPSKGIEGTSALLDFLKGNHLFEEVNVGEAGDIIINATGTGNGKARGHVGVIGHECIMSNNSETGLWSGHWTIERWQAYYQHYAGIPTRFFRPIG